MLPCVYISESKRQYMGWMMMAIMFILVGFGFVFAVFAIYIDRQTGAFKEFMDGYAFVSLWWMLMFCGTFMTVYFLAGSKLVHCSMNVKKRSSVNLVLLIYMVILAVFLLCEFALSVMCLTEKMKLRASVSRGFSKALSSYANDIDIKKSVDLLQMNYACCGERSYADWFNVQWIQNKYIDVNTARPDDSVPFSCCDIEAVRSCVHVNVERNAVGYDPQNDRTLYETGCTDVITSSRRFSGLVPIGFVGLVAFVLVILLLITMRYYQTSIAEAVRHGNPVKSTYGYLYAGKKNDGISTDSSSLNSDIDKQDSEDKDDKDVKDGVDYEDYTEDKEDRVQLPAEQSFDSKETNERDTILDMTNVNDSEPSYNAGSSRQSVDSGESYKSELQKDFDEQESTHPSQIQDEFQPSQIHEESLMNIEKQTTTVKSESKKSTESQKKSQFNETGHNQAHKNETIIGDSQPNDSQQNIMSTNESKTSKGQTELQISDTHGSTVNTKHDPQKDDLTQTITKQARGNHRPQNASLPKITKENMSGHSVVSMRNRHNHAKNMMAKQSNSRNRRLSLPRSTFAQYLSELDNSDLDYSSDDKEDATVELGHGANKQRYQRSKQYGCRRQERINERCDQGSSQETGGRDHSSYVDGAGFDQNRGFSSDGFPWRNRKRRRRRSYYSDDSDEDNNWFGGGLLRSLGIGLRKHSHHNSVDYGSPKNVLRGFGKQLMNKFGFGRGDEDSNDNKPRGRKDSKMKYNREHSESKRRDLSRGRRDEKSRDRREDSGRSKNRSGHDKQRDESKHNRRQFGASKTNDRYSSSQRRSGKGHKSHKSRQKSGSKRHFGRKRAG